MAKPLSLGARFRRQPRPAFGPPAFGVASGGLDRSARPEQGGCLHGPFMQVNMLTQLKDRGGHLKKFPEVLDSMIPM